MFHEEFPDLDNKTNHRLPFIVKYKPLATDFRYMVTAMFETPIDIYRSFNNDYLYHPVMLLDLGLEPDEEIKSEACCESAS
jgi:hypothetical protein